MSVFYPASTTLLKEFTFLEGVESRCRAVAHVTDLQVVTNPPMLEITTDLALTDEGVYPNSRKNAMEIVDAVRAWIHSMGLVDPYTRIIIFSDRKRLLYSVRMYPLVDYI